MNNNTLFVPNFMIFKCNRSADTYIFPSGVMRNAGNAIFLRKSAKLDLLMKIML